MNPQHVKWLIVAGLAVTILFLLNLLPMVPARVIASNLRQATTNTPTSTRTPTRTPTPTRTVSRTPTITTTPTPFICDDDVCLEGAYNTINFDGQVTLGSEWRITSERLGLINGLDYYVTWDENYLYVGMRGGNILSDKYILFIDVDPNDLGEDNSGATMGIWGAEFGADGKPDYGLQIYSDGWRAVQGNDDWVTWMPASTSGDYDYRQAEFRVSWSDIGLNDRGAPVGLYLYALDSNDHIWSAWPPSNLQYTGSEHILTTRTYFPTTDNYRSPRLYARQIGTETHSAATGFISVLNGFAQFNVTTGGGAGCELQVSVRGNAAADRNWSAVRRLYDITPINCPGLTADLTLKYLDGSEYEAVNEFYWWSTDEANLHLFHWTGSSWVDEGGTVNTVSNTVTSNNIGSFSPWTFDDGAGPTATTLAHLEGQQHSATPLALLLLGSAVLTGAGLVLWKRRQA